MADLEIEIPAYFICPITLEMMKDPVTIPTGITYDRDSIEKWLFTQQTLVCPVTRQTLDPSSQEDLVTPNITLRRLIQSWCTLHAPDGVHRLPSPKSHLTKPQILTLLRRAHHNPLQTLRSISSLNLTNKRSLESAGAPRFLSAHDSSHLRDEALSILSALQLSDPGLKALNQQPGFFDSLALTMQLGSYESRACAVVLLKSMLEVADPSLLINLRPEFFSEFRQTLDDQISRRATKETLKALVLACPWGRNRIKAVEAGLVPVLVHLLLDCFDKSACEMMLTVLDLLCQCAEGRAELLRHGAGLAVVSKKILRVSQGASDKAVRILSSVSRFCASHAVLHEMLQVGVVAKLCLVAQVDCGSRTRERAREILKLHSRAWRNSSCIPRNFITSYPS